MKITRTLLQHHLPRLAGWGLFALALTPCGQADPAAVGVASATTSTTTRVSPPGKEDELLCGPRALVGAAARLGVYLELNDCASRCTLTDQGVSLLSLKLAANAAGFTAEGARLTWEQLVALETPAILFVSGHHFVFADPRERAAAPAGTLRLYDFPKAARWVKADELQKIWHGEALILSLQKDLPPRAALQFDTLLEDFGPVYANSPVSHQFRFRNTSPDALSLTGIETTCGCTKAVLDKETLAPGESGALAVTLDLEGRKGAQRQVIRVLTSDPALPELTVVYQGTVINPIHVSSEVLDLGEVLPGATATGQLVLTDRAGGTLDLTGVSARFNDQATSEPPVRVNARWERTGEAFDETLAGPDEQVETVTLIRGGRGDLHWRLTVDAAIPAEARPGPHLGRLLVATNDLHYPQVEIPLSYTVAAGIRPTVDKLSLGIVRPAGPPARRQFFLERPDGKELGPLEFDLEAHAGPAPLRPAVTLTRLAVDRARVEVTLEPGPAGSQPAGLYQGVIRFHTPDRPPVSVPWQCLMKKI